MWNHHPHNEEARAVADFLNARHNTEFTEEDLVGALQSLGLGLVKTKDTGSAAVAHIEGTDNAVMCSDGPEGCTGDVTAVAGARHTRCEHHWSVFFESEGM